MSLREDLVARFPALARMPGDAWVVGGAVRDLLLNREPADVDVTCLDPEAAARLVRSRVIRLGSADELFAWRVVDGGHVYDFAPTLDGDIHADLRRRDFTINAMAVRVQDGAFLDPHGGERDLERRRVRMVREENFDDDPLRVLKGVRLAARLGFEIEPATLAAMKQRAPHVRDVAPERVSYELDLILGAGVLAKAAQLLRDSDLGRVLGLRDVPIHEDVLTLPAAYALLIEDVSRFARRWRWARVREREVVLLQKLVTRHSPIELYDAGETVARQLPSLLRAMGVDASLDWPEFSVRPLLDGEEIGGLAGLPAGRRLGEIARSLLEAQIEGKVTTRAAAERFVRELTRRAADSSQPGE